MPVALILQIFTIAQAAAAGAPAAIEAVNRIKSLIANKGEKVTVDELASALAGATDAHQELQQALAAPPENRSPVALENTSSAQKAVPGARTTAGSVVAGLK